MSAALRREDLLRFRLPSFQRKLARARDLVAEALDRGIRPYVAFSGGKDSLCALAITARVAPGATAIWVDDELEYPEQPEYIPALCQALGVRLVVKTGTQLHADWFRPWSEEPYWRDPLPGTVWTRESVRVLAPRWGFDGVVLGLRGEEAHYRRRYLAAQGRLHRGSDGVWRCNPLAGWTVRDVWALIAGWELPHNPAYDRMARLGLPRDRQRVGPLPLSERWVLKEGWPEIWNRLVERYGPRW